MRLPCGDGHSWTQHSPVSGVSPMVSPQFSSRFRSSSKPGAQRSGAPDRSRELRRPIRGSARSSLRTWLVESAPARNEPILRRAAQQKPTGLNKSQQNSTKRRTNPLVYPPVLPRAPRRGTNPMRCGAMCAFVAPCCAAQRDVRRRGTNPIGRAPADEELRVGPGVSRVACEHEACGVVAKMCRNVPSGMSPRGFAERTHGVPGTRIPDGDGSAVGHYNYG
jgi:hypothetical protein